MSLRLSHAYSVEPATGRFKANSVRPLARVRNVAIDLESVQGDRPIHRQHKRGACAVSVVTLTEVLIAPSANIAKLAAAREAIAALGVAVHQLNEAIGVEAARLRRRHPIGLPDAYCLATAKHTSSAVSSFDQRF